MLKEFSSLYWAQRFIMPPTGAPSLHSIQNQINLAIVNLYIIKIHFNIILSPTPRFSKAPSPFKSLGIKFCMHFTCSSSFHFNSLDLINQFGEWQHVRNSSRTRWFKYNRDYLCVNKSQSVPVIFEPPCIFLYLPVISSPVRQNFFPKILHLNIPL